MQKRALILFLFGFHFLLNGQTLIETNKLNNPLPIEQIDLVTDRDLYLSGESIWFRADISLDDNLKELSKILYIELFNAHQKSIVRKKYRIIDGFAQGILDIPSEFLSNTYFLRAYTNYTKNFGPETYFLSAIQIINPRIGLPAQINNNQLKPSIYYDSNLKEASAKITFSIPQNLISENTKAFLAEKQTLLKECDILENGWGMFDFIPNDSIQYSLVFTTAKNDTIKKDLIIPQPDSFLIESKLSSNGQQIVSIYQQNDIQDNTTNTYTLELLNNRLHILSSSEFLLSNNKTQIVLPNSKILDPGLYYFILKDASKNILKIKAFIIDDETKVSSETLINEHSYKKRQAVAVPLNELNISEYANFGIKAVQKGTVLPIADKLKIYLDDPYLTLSYLKTQFNPSELNSVEQDIYLHILNEKLKTQEFKTLFNEPTQSILQWVPEVRDIGLSGIVVNKLTQKPVEDVPVYLSIFRKYPQIHIYKSRADGSFFFSLNNFESEQDVFLCPLFENVDELELKVNRDFSPIFPSLKAIPLSIDSSYTSLIEQMMISAQTAKAYSITPKNQDKSISHLPYSFENPQISVVLDDYIETPTLEMVIKELVPSVRVKKKKGNYSLSIFDSERELFYNNPLILVDEVPVFNVNELLKIKPEVIEKIEVHKSPFILGDHTINGIIIIRTFTDNFGGMVMPQSSTFFEYQTLSPSYIFKAQTYEKKDEKNSRKGDFRTLLYWNSSIQMSTQSPIKFYTSDQTGEFETYIFGTLKNGQSTQFKLFNLNVVE